MYEQFILKFVCVSLVNIFTMISNRKCAAIVFIMNGIKIKKNKLAGLESGCCDAKNMVHIAS